MYPFRNVLKRVIIDRNDMLTRSKTRSGNSMSVNTTNYVVKHDPEAGQFYINLNGDSAFIQYEKLANIYNFYETLVPIQHQRKGIGKILAKAAFEFVISDKKKIQLSCTYLQKFYHENYETYKDHVLDDDVVEH